MKFAGFWQRFFAGLIDLLVLLPATALLSWLGTFSRISSLLFLVLNGLLYVSYTFAFHARTGQTLGKRALNIRVVALDGTRIGWRQALLRSSVDLVFSVLWIAGGISGWLALSDTEFATLGWWELEMRLVVLRPPFIWLVDMANFVWASSEVIVMLFNRQRRALHDFLAGTLVVKNR